jgi:hypothetical protein
MPCRLDVACILTFVINSFFSLKLGVKTGDITRVLSFVFIGIMSFRNKASVSNITRVSCPNFHRLCFSCDALAVNFYRGNNYLFLFCNPYSEKIRFFFYRFEIKERKNK